MTIFKYVFVSNIAWVFTDEKQAFSIEQQKRFVVNILHMIPLTNVHLSKQRWLVMRGWDFGTRELRSIL